MLRGEALEYTQGAFPGAHRAHAPALFTQRRVGAGADRWLHAFSVRELPKSPAERFKALFAERPRWTRDEIEPYLAVRALCV